MAKETRVSFLDKLIGEAIGQQRSVGLPDDPARERFPLLWDWLTRTNAGKDYIKQPARLSVTMAPEGLIVSVTDPDLARSMSVPCAHLEQAFDAFEKALAGPNPPITMWGKKQPTLRKRKAVS